MEVDPDGKETPRSRAFSLDDTKIEEDPLRPESRDHCGGREKQKSQDPHHHSRTTTIRDPIGGKEINRRVEENL